MLKAKKIGGLEECFDETMTDEVSDEEEDGDGESPSGEQPPTECLKQNDKVSVNGNIIYLTVLLKAKGKE